MEDLGFALTVAAGGLLAPRALALLPAAHRSRRVCLAASQAYLVASATPLLDWLLDTFGPEWVPSTVFVFIFMLCFGLSWRALPIGVTGGIACGKSTVTQVFKQVGMHIIDADRISRAVQAPGGPAFQPLIAAFGHGILTPEGDIDRPALGKLVFGDSAACIAARKRLNSIMHAAIARECLWQLLVRGVWEGRQVVYDAALMAETGSWLLAWPQVLVLHCDRAVQLQRLAARDGLSPADAEARIASQAPPAKRLSIANKVLDSSRGTPAELQAAALQAVQSWV